MRIDAHQHFWRYNDREYGWMRPDMHALRRDFLPADLRPLRRLVGIDGTVAVQARRTLAETEWLLSLADGDDSILGVVGWLDMAAPTLAGDLGRLAAHPRLVGVRELIHDMPDPDFATSDVHVRALSLLAPLDLAYDLLVEPRHLPAATALVDLLPRQRFVLDHIGKPAIRPSRRPGGSGVDETWRRGVDALAERPNVTCKLSGLLTLCDPEEGRAEDIEPYVDHVLAAFGPARLMIGSDWPVSTLAADYATTMGRLVDVAMRLSPHERDDLLAGTCARAYRLELGGAAPAREDRRGRPEGGGRP